MLVEIDSGRRFEPPLEGSDGEARPMQASRLLHGDMHAVLAFAALPLFLGALLSDWAYAGSYHVQWTNFASWLIAGGLVFAGVALLWAAVDVLGSSAMRHRRGMMYLLLLLASFVLGFINSLVHAKDAWAAMPAGLVLSAVVLLLAVVASVIGLAGLRRRTA
jgi:uncharacterized membrane protein